MNKRLEYTLVAEGFAEYAFIPVYLTRIAEKYKLQVVRSSLDLLKKQPSKSKVLNEAEDLCLRALVDEKHSFCIVGVDLDKPDHTDDQKIHQNECKALIEKLGTAHKKYKQQIMIYVPIQAIEHWLAYQLYVIKSSKKPVTGSIEKEPQAKLKKDLYGEKENRRQMELIARTVAEKADFDELAKQSRSFNHFHRQIVNFLTNHQTTQP